MNKADKNIKIISLEVDKIFKWGKGVCLQAVETSLFYIPGGLFKEGVKMQDVIEISDDEADILVVEETKKNTYPDIIVALKSGETMRLNKNCEVILVQSKSEKKKIKEFVVK